MDSVKMAFESIRDKKIRSLLTMLGIIIGVGAVLILVSVVQGYNADLTAYYEKQGVNKVNVTLLNFDRTNTTDQSSEFMDWVNESLSAYITGVTPSASTSGTLRFESNINDTAVIYFGNEQWSACNNYTLDEGRDLLELDMAERSRVCVIGSYLADTLFGFQDPIGQTLSVNGTPLTVVGVFYQKDGGVEESMDDAVVVPYTLNRQMLGTDTVSEFTVKVASSTDMTTVMNQVESWCAENVDTNTGEYTVENGNDAMEAAEDETASLQVVLGGVAAIALLVGGIGIMNIMLVSVTERTREIGIRKSLGAKRRDIRSQFVIEAGTTSAIGGLLGIALGRLLAMGVGSLIGGMLAAEMGGSATFSAAPTLSAVAISFGVSVGIGVLFGYLPANKAAKLNPIDALRYD